MAAISVYLTVTGWPVERILRVRMHTRAGTRRQLRELVRAAGYELVPTGRVPHFSLVLPAASAAEATALLAHFGLYPGEIPTEEGGDDERHEDRDRHSL